MRRKGRSRSLSNLRRQEPKETAAKGCSGCDQTERAGVESPASNEAKESRAVSPPKTCKEERTDATGGEKRALSVAGPEGRKRVCIICSKPSDEMICGACADKVSADALEKKRWEEKGKP
jgi:hypothetical protein